MVDQFEEVFTDCREEDQRQALHRRGSARGPAPAVVVLALRADFYARALRYPAARGPRCRNARSVLGPMSPAQVRSAIVEPARLARLDVADGLVEVLLRELAPRTAAAAAGRGLRARVLPLLSHALLATWEHSRGGR